MGLAHANTIGLAAIPDTHSFNMVPGPGLDIARTASAPAMASLMPPSTQPGFVSMQSWRISLCISAISGLLP